MTDLTVDLCIFLTSWGRICSSFQVDYPITELLVTSYDEATRLLVKLTADREGVVEAISVGSKV